MAVMSGHVDVDVRCVEVRVTESGRESSLVADIRFRNRARLKEG